MQPSNRSHGWVVGVSGFHIFPALCFQKAAIRTMQLVSTCRVAKATRSSLLNLSCPITAVCSRYPSFKPCGRKLCARASAEGRYVEEEDGIPVVTTSPIEAEAHKVDARLPITVCLCDCYIVRSRYAPTAGNAQHTISFQFQNPQFQPCRSSLDSWGLVRSNHTHVTLCC